MLVGDAACCAGLLPELAAWCACRPSRLCRQQHAQPEQALACRAASSDSSCASRACMTSTLRQWLASDIMRSQEGRALRRVCACRRCLAMLAGCQYLQLRALAKQIL